MWFSVRHSESSCLSFIRSITIFPVLAFRTIRHTPLGFLAHFFSLILAFRAMFHTHSCILGNLFFLVLAFRVVVRIHSGISSHHFLSSFWRSESFLLSHIIQSHSPWHSCPLSLPTWPSGSYIHPHFPHLITLCLSRIHRLLVRIPPFTAHDTVF